MPRRVRRPFADQSRSQSEQQVFESLDLFHKDLTAKRALQSTALEQFYDDSTKGFRSSQDRRAGHLSPSSTCTCIVSLIATSQWSETRSAGHGPELVSRLLADSLTTSGLDSGNFYTEAFLLEAVDTLLFDRSDGSCVPYEEYRDLASNADVLRRLEDKQRRITEGLKGGFARIGHYPPSAYMSQLGVRVLKQRQALSPDLSQDVTTWANIELTRQLALILAGSKSADLHQLAYCAILIASLEEPGRATPDQRLLTDAALQQLFASQLADGTWPRSAPIFDLPGVGSSYCYEYEMLTQLLTERRLEERLLGYLPSLRLAYDSLVRTAYQHPHGTLAWASGHRQQAVQGPESWATASAYHFVHSLERLISESLRRSVFKYVRVPYVRPTRPRKDRADFAPRLLDMPLILVNGTTQSLKDTLYESFVAPIAADASRVEAGRAMRESTPNTMVLFGPPGTSKTELTRAVADFLNWPQLPLDPSHFVRNGIDRISPEADLLFSMLNAMDRVVVLLDEIDELVRERSVSPEVLSRFLTTSMLPKLATINKLKRVIFIVATNHIEQFDMAISRPGRFDVILQIMPPTVDAKLDKWPILRDRLGRPINEDSVRRDQLSQLTFAETVRLVERLGSPGARQPLDDLGEEFRGCTLNSVADQAKDSQKTWQKVSITQRDRVRGLKFG
jgi:hypothetical protein